MSHPKPKAGVAQPKWENSAAYHAMDASLVEQGWPSYEAAQRERFAPMPSQRVRERWAAFHESWRVRLYAIGRIPEESRYRSQAIRTTTRARAR